VVLWRCRYRLNLQDLAEMLLRHGIVFTQEAVQGRQAKLALLFSKVSPIVKIILLAKLVRYVREVMRHARP
jgi:hypothetical protein